RPDGPEPVLRPFATAEAESAFLVERIRDSGSALEDVAVLCRTHARLADFEQVLHEAGIPSQGAALLSRESARLVLRRLRDGEPVAAQVRSIAVGAGWLERPPDRLGERELTRQNDLTRLVR